MEIKIHDANRDYVIVSWKPPNTTTEGPIIGYFVDRSYLPVFSIMKAF